MNKSLIDTIHSWIISLDPVTSLNYAYAIQRLRIEGYIPCFDRHDNLYTVEDFNAISQTGFVKFLSSNLTQDPERELIIQAYNSLREYTASL